MEESPGLVSSLAGHLIFDLAIAGVLTWPVSIGLLRLYTRTVSRSMRRLSGVTQGPEAAERRKPGESARLAPAETAPLVPEAQRLLARLTTRPRHAAAVYAVAGFFYALVLGVATLWSFGLEILPIRLGMYIVVYAWPAIVAVMVTAMTTRWNKALLVVAYFAVIAALGALAMPNSPDLTWTQVFLVWLITALPPNLLLAACLSKRTRAVAPLILTVLLLAFLGADVALTWIGLQESRMRRTVELGASVGLGGTGTFVLTIVIGLLMFAALGWLVAQWIRRQYLAKQIGDESLVLDTTWFFFSMVSTDALARQGGWWPLASMAAFLVYLAISRAGWWWLRRTEPEAPAPVLLLLRSFSIGHESERLFDALEKHWRRTGSIEMIAGIDLNRRTVEPHEFLDFVSGRLSRRYIDGRDTLDRRMAERDLLRDRDGRFRVNEFFCYNDTWKAVLSRLVADSTVVLMDLRGFTASNQGCVFELQELASQVALEHVVFVVNATTDETLLAATLGPVDARVLRMGTAATGIDALLRALATSATARAAAGRADYAPLTPGPAAALGTLPG